MSSGGEDQVRFVAESFHRNFSAADFVANSDLLADDIMVDSNGVDYIGVKTFAERNTRFNTPFPDMQIRDRIMLVDGNSVAIQFVMQGTNTGPQGKSQPATGKQTEVIGAEIFHFDDDTKMDQLLTIMQLDQLDYQLTADAPRIKGFAHVQQQVSTPIAADSSKKQADTAADLLNGLATGDATAADDLMDPQAAVAIHQLPATLGTNDLKDEWSSLHKTLPDLKITLQDPIQDGDRTAIPYTITGTQTGPFTAVDGTVHQSTGKPVTTDAVAFFRFNQEGKVIDLVSVRNTDIITNQIK